MPNPRLLQFLKVIVILNTLHLVDHIIREDFHWPLDEQSIGFLIVATVILGGMGIGISLYRVGHVGARFWTIIGLLGLGLGWLSHFSPMTDQPLLVIYQGYAAPWGGALAVGCLLALMLCVLGATAYSAYLWARQGRS
ncbi:MAG: hypothetical protein U0172_01635 [Nitrospiraceae bacterium]